MTKLTRRQVARYAANEIAHKADRSQLFGRLAQWLIETKSVRTAELLLADIEGFLAREHGLLFAHVTSAHSLTKELSDTIEATLASKQDAKKVELSYDIDTTLIGGVIVRTSEQEIDTSIATSIKKMRAIKEQ